MTVVFSPFCHQQKFQRKYTLKKKNTNYLCLDFQLFNPSESFSDIVIEHEYVECTGSAIQALVLFKKLYPEYKTKEIDNFIANAVRFIESSQTIDGSWSGNWGFCFIYGSCFALGGLEAAGKTYTNCPAIAKATKFLLQIQREDGGWGESYLSCSQKVRY